MSKQKVIIRADGNSDIGLGHIYRGIALAEMLKNEFDIYFITKPNSTINPITELGFNYIFLPKIFFLDEPKWLKQNIDLDSIIVCDGYEFKSEYQKKIKQEGFKLVYIDDLAEYHMYADIVINHSPGIKKEDYEAEPYTRFALGLNYALLRQSFLNFDNTQKKSPKKTENIFVSFGGADPNDFTFQTIENLVNIKSIKSIFVVLGSAYKHNKVQKINSNKVKIFKSLSDTEILELMTKTNLAIVPASTISIELASVNVPMLLGYFVENQKIIYNGFIENNAAYPLGDFNKKDFSELNKDLDSYTNKKDKLNLLTVSKPNKNIIKLFRHLLLSIRTVKENDIHFVFNLSNESLVRKNSYNSEKINFESHKKWFEDQLKNYKELFFILEYHQKPFGQVRFTLKHNHSVIGIAISNKNRGMGLASQSLILATNKYFQKYDLPIYAYIKKTNTASVQSFKNAGFIFYKDEIIDGIESFVYIKNK